MKKIGIVALLLMTFILCSCFGAREEHEGTIISISYRLTSSFVPFVKEKFIDFSTNEYKTRNYVENFENYEDMFDPPIQNNEEFETISTFAKEEALIYLEGIKKAGLLKLRERYEKNNIYDGDGWKLTIIFEDGFEFVTTGYMKSPSCAKKINELSNELFGHNLFVVYKLNGE